MQKPSRDPRIASGDKPLMEFYRGGDGDLKIRAWDLYGNECIAFIRQVDAKALLNYIHATKYKEKHTRYSLDILR